MQQDIYSPSLQGKDVGETKSFQIGNLFFVAFFGGVLAVTILGLLNAKWLRLERKTILSLAAASAGLFICKHLVFVAIANGMLDVKDAMFNDIYRGFGILAFVAYYFTLRQPFKAHLALGGDTKRMFGKGLLWAVVSLFIEVFLLQMLGLK